MTKTCDQCSAQFEITNEDLKFYDKFSPVFNNKKYSVPPPTHCTDCRSQRRLIWRPELHLFKRKSDFSGKSILSAFPPQAESKVYSREEWWSDDWNALDYGKDFDFSRTFFDQFSQLVREVPLMQLSVNNNENSDYINSASYNKNCYLLAGANRSEDCYYGNFVNGCTNCVDCNFISDSELCYECVDCTKCYNLKYSFNAHNCSDSYFLYNCRDCHHCFGSVNLVNKKYCFFNQQLSKEEYEKKIQDIPLHSRASLEKIKQYFQAHRLKYPHRYFLGEMNENVVGNAISNCRNTFASFDVSNLEDCRYCTWFHQSKDCMDCYSWGFSAEECYESLEVGDGSHRVLFSVLAYGGVDVLYSYHNFYCQSIFGCVGLKRKKYCILNKQYSQSEYEMLVSKIIEHMQKTKEWGEFFPMSVSPYAYNQTIAQDYFPIEQEHAKSMKAKWNDETSPSLSQNISVIPDSIREVEVNICEQTFTCAQSDKSFKIIPQEFQFYKTNNIPLPNISFFERHKNRLAQRNPRKLWTRKCMKCEKEIQTTYSPDRPETVYCEECYLGEVY